MKPEVRFEIGEATRKLYSRDCKLNAIRLTTEYGATVAQTARAVGLNENTLHCWRKELRWDPQHALHGRGCLKPLQEENRQLQCDNPKLRQEVAFPERLAVWPAREAH
jgi:transposase-like protein